MGSDNFTGVVKFIIKKNNETFYKYTIINAQCPDDYHNFIDNFKRFFDVNNLYWTTSEIKIYDLADEYEKKHPTNHGIILIDYTKAESLEMRIMYSSEYKYLNGIKNISYFAYTCFNIIIHILYILFILKLYSNLYY